MISTEAVMVGMWAVVFCFPIPILISLFAFQSYHKVGSWKILFLSLAFLLLAIPMLFVPATFAGWILDPGHTGTVLIGYTYYLTAFTSVIAFAILAYVYLDEKRDETIKIGRVAKGIFYILVVMVWGFTAYMFVESFLGPLPMVITTSWLLGIARLIAASISITLLIMVISSLRGYKKTERTRGTTKAIIGFSFILVAQLLMNLYYAPQLWSELIDLTSGWIYALIGVTNFAGYLTFYTALYRLKGSS
jgi:hypothetical protein